LLEIEEQHLSLREEEQGLNFSNSEQIFAIEYVAYKTTASATQLPNCIIYQTQCFILIRLMQFKARGLAYLAKNE